VHKVRKIPAPELLCEYETKNPIHDKNKIMAIAVNH